MHHPHPMLSVKFACTSSNTVVAPFPHNLTSFPQKIRLLRRVPVRTEHAGVARRHLQLQGHLRRHRQAGARPAAPLRWRGLQRRQRVRRRRWRQLRCLAGLRLPRSGVSVGPLPGWAGSAARALPADLQGLRPPAQGPLHRLIAMCLSSAGAASLPSLVLGRGSLQSPGGMRRSNEQPAPQNRAGNTLNIFMIMSHVVRISL